MFCSFLFLLWKKSTRHFCSGFFTSSLFFSNNIQFKKSFFNGKCKLSLGLMPSDCGILKYVTFSLYYVYLYQSKMPGNSGKVHQIKFRFFEVDPLQQGFQKMYGFVWFKCVDRANTQKNQQIYIRGDTIHFANHNF